MGEKACLVAATVKDNPFLEGLFDERYRLEWEMGRQYQLFLLGKKVRLPDYDHEIALFSFIVMVSCVSQSLSAEGRNRLSGMLRSGLDAKHGIASVEFEFIIATHLMQHGFDVEFSDIEGESRVDMLARRDGAEIEVECKTVNCDLGRKIPRRKLYQLGGHVRPLMTGALDNAPGGQLARIILPERLKGSDQQLHSIYEQLKRVLQSGTSEPGPEPCAIEYHKFALAENMFNSIKEATMSEEDAREYIEREVGFPINNTIMYFGQDLRAIVVAVESQQSDRVMDTLVRQLKKTAKHQLSGNRPSAICLRFADVTEAQLVEIGESHKSGQASTLQLATRAFSMNTES